MSNVKFRLVAFTLMILVVAITIGGAAHIAWMHFEQLQARFNSTAIASFRSADQFRATLEELDYLLLRYDAGHDEADWEKFDRDRKKLDRWIDEQQPALTTPQERAILQQINEAYDDYQQAALRLHPDKSEPHLRSISGTRVDDVEPQSKRLLDLAFQLAEAHQQSLKLFLAGFEGSMASLRWLILGALFALLVLGAWLAMIVYRDMIAPLHRQLVESQAIIERQEKLASLGVLAAGVAHEIRNPLTAIKARLFTQQKLLKSGSAESEDAAVIGTEINRLERIVRDVLQFARPAEPNLTRVAAQEPLRDVQDLLGPQLERNAIALRVGNISDAYI